MKPLLHSRSSNRLQQQRHYNNNSNNNNNANNININNNNSRYYYHSILLFKIINNYRSKGLYILRCIYTISVSYFCTIESMIGTSIGTLFFLLLLYYHSSRHHSNSYSSSNTKTLVHIIDNNSNSHMMIPTTSFVVQQQQQQQQQQQLQQEQRIDLSTRRKDQINIGFAVSITGCGSNSNDNTLYEGFTILHHSIHRASIHGRSSSSISNTNSTGNGGQYDYTMYIIYHPDAKECVLRSFATSSFNYSNSSDSNKQQQQQQHPYILLERDTPIQIEQIRGEYLRSKIHTNGCCGEKELIKLEAYTLIQHPIIVHLDIDTLVLQPLDILFDYMLTPQNHPNYNTVFEAIRPMMMWSNNNNNQTLPTNVNAMFTLDYNLVKPRVQYKPVQGGFLILRPSIQVYNQYKEILYEGNFQQGTGWGGVHVGPFYGSMTFQGIIPYYYYIIQQQRDSIELNRCYYNSMADNPRTVKTKDNIVSGPCRTGQSEEECQDCRTVPISQIYTVHYTICQKPWLCLPHDQNTIQHILCKQLVHEWYHIRYEYLHYTMGIGTYKPGIFYGYCNELGTKGYIPISQSFG